MSDDSSPGWANPGGDELGTPPSLPMPPAPPAGAGSLAAPPSLPAPPAPRPTFGAAPQPGPASRDYQTPLSPAPEPSLGGRSTAGFWLLGAAIVIVLLVGFLLLRGDSGETAGEPVEEARSGSAGDQEPDPGEEPDDSGQEPGDETDEGPSFFGAPFRPDSVDVDASSVWVSDAACGVVLRIDKATEEVVGAVSVSDSASGIAVAGGSVWVGSPGQAGVVRIDPERMAVSGSVPVPGFALGLTARGNDVWATDPVTGAVHRIDAARAERVETVRVGLNPHHVATSDSAVWVTNQGEDTATLIVTGGGTFDVPVGAQPLHVEIGAGSAWITDSGDNAVRRVNETTGELEAVIDVGTWPHALAVANGFVWVGTETGSFWRVDPSNNTAERVDDAEFSSIDTVVDGNDIWIADASGGTVVRFDAAAGGVGSVIDLNQFGDCESFGENAGEPEPDTRAPSL